MDHRRAPLDVRLIPVSDDPPAGAPRAVRTELLGERRNQFFNAYMTKARERMQINVNQQAIAQLLA